MTKSITTQELKANVGEFVDSVRLRGDRYVIQRRGKPVAALVPLSVNDAYENNRDQFFNLLNDIAERNKDMTVDEINSLVSKTVKDVRREKSRNKRPPEKIKQMKR